MLYNREVYIAQWRRIVILFYWKQRKITTELRIVFPYGVQAELLCYRYRKRI
uniref:Uncharacterized protein n=1 Tax=Rhizophagus irregularis (strain DAOM 181602 / DAOM 197198 / MUCL 43194) TaxID=747089 RepID=U9V884_RHIID